MRHKRAAPVRDRDHGSLDRSDAAIDIYHTNSVGIERGGSPANSLPEIGPDRA
jgi:hypothetical protein